MNQSADPGTLSVIIVNYNAGRHLMDCVRSLLENTPDVSLDIIIIDNASTDDSLRPVSDAFPDINIIVNSQNLGFAAACNQGIRKARGGAILLLNPDTRVPVDAVREMLTFLNDTQAAGIVGPRLVDLNGNPRNSCSAFTTLWHYLFDILFLPKLFPRSKLFNRFHLAYADISEPTEVDVVAGAFFMLKRAVVDDIGLLDESYFIYTEERDFCYRAKQASWKVYCFPLAEVVHIGGISTRQQAVGMYIEQKRSMLRFHQKFDSRLKAGLIRALIFLAVLVRSLVWSIIAALRVIPDAKSRRQIYTSAVLWFLKENGKGEYGGVEVSK